MKYLHKDEGFTLVELLVTLVLLSLIAGISVAMYSSVRSDSEDKTYEVSKAMIEDAAAIKDSKDFGLDPYSEPNYTFTVGELVESGYLDLELPYEAGPHTIVASDTVILTPQGYKFDKFNIVQDGLTYWYDFKYDHGTTIPDLSGNGHELVMKGFDDNSGHRDNGIVFDGSDDYLINESGSYHTNREMPDSIHIQATYKTNGTKRNTLASVGYLNYDLAVQDTDIWMWFGDKTHVNKYWGWRSQNNPGMAPHTITTVDIAADFKNNVIKYYVNGTLVNTLSGEPAAKHTMLDNYLTVGVRSQGSYTANILNGKLYSVKAYENKTLTDDEIKQNAEAEQARFNNQ